MNTYTYDADTLSDLHKDAYGFRPRSESFWAAWNEADDTGKQAIWDDLIEASTAAEADDLRQKSEAEAVLEASIAKAMGITSGTREDVIRYLDDANGTDGDLNYLEWKLGVSYGFLGGRKW